MSKTTTSQAYLTGYDAGFAAGDANVALALLRPLLIALATAEGALTRVAYPVPPAETE